MAEQREHPSSRRWTAGAPLTDGTAVFSPFYNQVTAIRQDMWGLELEITGVDLQEVARFYDAYEAHMEAEQAMGPLM